MSGQELDRQVDEFVRIAIGLHSLKGRFKVALPEDVVELKRLLGKGDLPADCDLFFRIANLLSGRAQALTMSELSRALAVPLSTATRMVDWQVTHGYVQRLPDPQDRRIVRVSLSPAGRQLFSHVQGLLRERIRRLAMAFTAEERETLIALLWKLVTMLENGREPGVTTTARRPRAT